MEEASTSIAKKGTVFVSDIQKAKNKGRNMTLTLEMTPEQEQQLALKAEQQGMDTRDYALAVLFHEKASGSTAEEALPLAGPLPLANGTGADLVAYWEREGIIGTRPDIQDSQKHARELRRKAESRTRE